MPNRLYSECKYNIHKGNKLYAQCAKVSYVTLHYIGTGSWTYGFWITNTFIFVSYKISFDTVNTLLSKVSKFGIFIFRSVYWTDGTVGTDGSKTYEWVTRIRKIWTNFLLHRTPNCCSYTLLLSMPPIWRLFVILWICYDQFASFSSKSFDKDNDTPF